MDFNFTDEQKMLRESARGFCEDKSPMSFVLEMEEDEKGYTPELWKGMAELGWMGLVIPEEYGGVGLSFADLIVLLEEMGRVCLPGPFFSTVVLGGLTILEGGNESQKNEFLPKIANGEIILSVALAEPSSTQYDPSLIEVTATAEQDRFIIDGTKLFVSDANVADYIICAARTQGEPASKDGITLFFVDAKSPGIKCSLLKTVAGDKQCEVIFDKVVVSEENVLGEVNGGWFVIEKILQKAAVAKCAEMVGGAQKVLEMAVEYAKQRVQFGKLIGTFQAVQHHCANMAIALQGSKFITYKAGWMLSEGVPCAMQVSAAKAWTSEAYKKLVILGHQIFAGTGFMAEHEMPMYSRRARAAELAFGDANYYRKMVAQDIGLAPRS